MYTTTLFRLIELFTLDQLTHLSQLKKKFDFRASSEVFDANSMEFIIVHSLLATSHHLNYFKTQSDESSK